MGTASPAASRLVVRDLVSEEEWQVRVDLAACYRLLARFGMTDLIYNHITARVPGPEHHILINTYGLRYEEITASNLQKIDIEGNSVLRGEGEFNLNPAGYVIHSAVHMGREDAGCVIHTHSRAASAVAAMESGLLPISQSAMFFYGKVGYHDFEALEIRNDERKRLIEDLGNNDAMLMRNHGTLIVGRSVPHAFLLAYQFESACRIQVDAMPGAPLKMPPPDICTAVQRRAEAAVTARQARLEWTAMLRMLDTSDPSYRC